jgi:hypothetical protein
MFMGIRLHVHIEMNAAFCVLADVACTWMRVWPMHAQLRAWFAWASSTKPVVYAVILWWVKSMTCTKYHPYHTRQPAVLINMNALTLVISPIHTITNSDFLCLKLPCSADLNLLLKAQAQNCHAHYAPAYVLCCAGLLCLNSTCDPWPFVRLA